MYCYSPLKGFIIPDEVTVNGFEKYKIADYRSDHIEKRRPFVGVGEPRWTAVYESDVSSDALGYSFDYIEIACGKCVGCRLQHSREWSIRCILEAGKHKHNSFLTLTYDDDHLHLSNFARNDTGEIIGTLNKKDLQDFWKRLRKAVVPEKLRYFACGEYGSKTYRPHYHAIVFGLEVPDKVFYRRSPIGDCYYTSDWLNKIWQNGNVIIGDVTAESCAYTARYVIKKAEDPDISDFYSDLDLQPEFLVMSRRPGIGFGAFEDDPDIDRYRVRYISTDRGSMSYTAPRYFRKCRERMAASSFDTDYYLDRLVNSWNSDLHQDAVKEVMKNGTDLNFIEYLEGLEGKKLREIKVLKRDKL